MHSAFHKGTDLCIQLIGFSFVKQHAASWPSDKFLQSDFSNHRIMHCYRQIEAISNSTPLVNRPYKLSAIPREQGLRARVLTDCGRKVYIKSTKQYINCIQELRAAEELGVTV